jgi:hypothetical protein
MMLLPTMPVIGVKLWYSLAGATWTIVLSRLLLFTQLRKSPLVWGINVGGILFENGMECLFLEDNADALWRWIAVTSFCYAPLIVFGIGTGCMLLAILGAFGLLTDVFRFDICLSRKLPESLYFFGRFCCDRRRRNRNWSVRLLVAPTRGGDSGRY